MKRCTLILSFLVVCTFSFAQTPTLQQKLYYTCKVWGFVKYFHSNVSTCGVNWDSVLVSVLPSIESAATSGAFNDALDTMLAAAGPMALSTTYFNYTWKIGQAWNTTANRGRVKDVHLNISHLVLPLT